MKDHGDCGYDDRDNERDPVRWCELKRHVVPPLQSPLLGRTILALLLWPEKTKYVDWV